MRIGWTLSHVFVYGCGGLLSIRLKVRATSGVGIQDELDFLCFALRMF